MNYLLMVCSVLLAVTNSSLLHKFANKGLDNAGDLFLFNSGTQAVWSILLLLFCTFTNTLQFDRQTVFYGFFYAALLCIFQVFKLFAYSSGPVAVTTLVGACAFIITTGYTVIFEGDTVTIPYLCGVAVLLIALFLCIDLRAKKTDSGMKISPKWMLWCFLMFLAGGGMGIFYRIFGGSSVSHNMNSMMFFAAVLSSLMLAAMALITNKATANPRPKVCGTAVKYMLVNGVTSCIYIRLNLSLANLLPGTLFFPVSNGAILILSTLTGIVFFNEKPSRRQLVGILTGLAAIAFIGIVQ